MALGEIDERYTLVEDGESNRKLICLVLQRAGVTIDPMAVIGPRAEIGSGTLIGAGAIVGPDVRIGRREHIDRRHVAPAQHGRHLEALVAEEVLRERDIHGPIPAARRVHRKRDRHRRLRARGPAKCPRLRSVWSSGLPWSGLSYSGRKGVGVLRA